MKPTNKKRVSQKELIAKSNLVNNNPHSIDMKAGSNDAYAIKYEKDHTLYDSKIDRVIEAFRKTREATSLNRFVSKREPGEPRKTEYLKIAPSAQKQYDADMEKLKRQNKRSSAQFRLKRKGKVPTKSGKPMWEEYGLLEEDFNKFVSLFRKYYYSGKMMRFREWLEVIDDLVDTL